MDGNITGWWLTLPPAKQYIYWIMAFCAMIAVGIGLVMTVVESAYASTLIMPVILGIGALNVFFMVIVLWITIRWPHIRDKE